MNILLYLAVLALWGTTWFGITLQLDSHVEPIISVGWRFLLASMLLFVWCLVRGKNLRFSFNHHKNWLIIGLCLFCANFMSLYTGTQYLPSGVVALIFSTITIFIIFNGALWFNKTISKQAMVGSIVGITGLGLVFNAELSQLPLQTSIGLDVVKLFSTT